jgi:alkylation response protein AidB-like acyl-CoA dehydrogenase
MLSFQPTEEQRLMVASVAEFSRSILRPRIREFERARGLPDDVRRAAHELGLGALGLSENVGGAGLGFVTAALLEEELAWGDASAPFALGGPGPFGLAVAELAPPEEARAILAPFAAEHLTGAVAWGEAKAHPDRPGWTTTAERTPEGWRLDGAKDYVINADRADRFVVFAQVDPGAGWRGMGAFLVDRGATGLGIGPRAETLGLDAASFGRIRLEGVKVKDEARLQGSSDFTAATLRFFAKYALLCAARSVGLARAAFELTREYVEGRKAFGKPIGHFQGVAFTIADRAIDVDASRALVWRAAAAWDAGGGGRGPADDAMLLTARAVATAHEGAMRCGNDGVQLHGGAGFMRDYLVEKLMRDAKQLGLCALTAEHADQLATALDLGQPLDPALVFPTPETQNAFV